MVFFGNGFARYHLDHSAFVHRTKFSLVILTVYVIDILLTGSGSALAEMKEYLVHHFATKDMGKPKYFLGIEVAYQKYASRKRVFLCVNLLAL